MGSKKKSRRKAGVPTSKKKNEQKKNGPSREEQASPPPLTWVAFYSEKFNREYYFEPNRNVVTWIRPDGFEDPTATVVAGVSSSQDTETKNHPPTSLIDLQDDYEEDDVAQVQSTIGRGNTIPDDDETRRPTKARRSLSWFVVIVVGVCLVNFIIVAVSWPMKQDGTYSSLQSSFSRWYNVVGDRIKMVFVIDKPETTILPSEPKDRADVNNNDNVALEVPFDHDTVATDSERSKSINTMSHRCEPVVEMAPTRQTASATSTSGDKPIKAATNGHNLDRRTVSGVQKTTNDEGETTQQQHTRLSFSPLKHVATKHTAEEEEELEEKEEERAPTTITDESDEWVSEYSRNAMIMPIVDVSRQQLSNKRSETSSSSLNAVLQQKNEDESRTAGDACRGPLSNVFRKKCRKARTKKRHDSSRRESGQRDDLPQEFAGESVSKNKGCSMPLAGVFRRKCRR